MIRVGENQPLGTTEYIEEAATEKKNTAKVNEVGTRTLSLVITDNLAAISISNCENRNLPFNIIEVRDGNQVIRDTLGDVPLSDSHPDREHGRFGIPNPELYGRVKLYREKNGELEEWTPLLTDVAQNLLKDIILDRAPLEYSLCEACHGVSPFVQSRLEVIPVDAIDGPRPAEWLMIGKLETSNSSARAVFHLRDQLCLFSMIEGIPLVCSIEAIQNTFQLTDVSRLVRDSGPRNQISWYINKRAQKTLES